MSNLEQTAREALDNPYQVVDWLTTLKTLAQGYLDLLAEKKDQPLNVVRSNHSKCDEVITQLKSENEKLDQKVLRLHGSLSKANSDRAKLVEGLKEAECECEISLPVNDYPRDVICIRCETLKEVGEL